MTEQSGVSMPSRGITSAEIDARNSTSPYWLSINANADFYRSKLVDLLRKYVPLGIVMGQELLLTPSDSLKLASDLQALGISLLGFDCWYRYFGSLRENTDIEFYVGDDAVWSDNPVYDTFIKVKNFIQSQLPTNTQYLSLTLHVPHDWKLFTN